MYSFGFQLFVSQSWLAAVTASGITPVRLGQFSTSSASEIPQPSTTASPARTGHRKTLRLRHRENFSRIWVFDLAARRIATHVDIFGRVGGTENKPGFVRHSLGCRKLRI